MGSCRVGVDVQILPGERFTSDSLGAHQLEQRVVDPHLQANVQLVVSSACLSLFDQMLDGRFERAVAGKPDALVSPQAIVVKLWNVPQRVVTPGMAVAGKVPDVGKTPENAHA